MTEIALIKISGKDRSGVTSTVTQLLSARDANILDIGQAVIHDNLVLGMLVELPIVLTNDITEFRDTLIADINSALGDMELQYEPVTESSYDIWTAEQGKPRHIVTLLARKITADHVQRVTELVSRHALNIDKITRLSGRVPIDDITGSSAPSSPASKACVEFSLRGELADATRVRNELLELANSLDVDVAYQEDDMFRRNRRLVVFDMDSTLIDCEVIDELAKVAGVGSEVAAITESAMRGEIDFQESFRRRVRLLRGMSESALQQVAGELRLTEGAETLIQTLKKLGYKTAILSGGFTYFGHRLQQQLGFDYVYANDLDIVDGAVTGEVNSRIVDGQRKAELLREIAQREGIALEQVIAIGDGANDLPMLSIAGLGVAFRAKPLVKESARQSISNLGLDSILYLLGISDRELLARAAG